MLRIQSIVVSILLFVLTLNANAKASQPLHKDAGITFGYAHVNGIDMHYAKTGHGKKLLLLVHGFPEFWYEYKDVLAAYANSDEYTVIAPDMRGYNLTSKPVDEKEYQVSYMVEDLRQLAESLHFKKFIMVAHDWGGVVAWEFAIVHPEYLNKLVIIDAPHPALFTHAIATNHEQQKASQYMAFFRSPQAEPVLSADHYAKLVDLVMGNGLKTGSFTEVDKEEYLKAWSQPGALTGGLNYYRASHDFGSGLSPSSYNVNVPTLVIWGEKDSALLVSLLDGLDQYVPNLTVKVIPGASHWVIHEKPDLVIGYIEDFID